MDSYTDYSDSSAPRTPSPNDVHPYTHHKDNIVYPIYSNNSLLQELYDDPQQYNFQQSQDNWHRIPQNNDLRRATFPYVRHEREDPLPYNYNHTQRHHDVHPYHYSDRAAPLDRDGSYMSSNSPHSTYEDTGNIKIEDGAPLVVPSQSSFYRTANPNGSPPLNMPYISPHTGLPIQHTDDAASKETQYLRRRCFNCHTTEPPSWRRSTLNPGKIVCNKCGLYERTHLRPRPLRFDELRSGNKATRKQKVPSSSSPRQPKLGVVKKEPREFGLVRRSSVSSSSVSSSGASDWDDNVSVYSSGSAPPTSFNSPTVPHFSLSSSSSRDSNSPPHQQQDCTSIRLPNNPLSELHAPSIVGHGVVPRRSQTSPVFYSPSPSLSAVGLSPSAQPPSSASGGAQQGLEYFAPRQGSGSPTLSQVESSILPPQGGLVSSPSS